MKLQASACNFIQKETLGQVFSYEFCEISKNTFSTEHLWATASAFLWAIAVSGFRPLEIYKNSGLPLSTEVANRGFL